MQKNKFLKLNNIILREGKNLQDVKSYRMYEKKIRGTFTFRQKNDLINVIEMQVGPPKYINMALPFNVKNIDTLVRKPLQKSKNIFLYRSR